MPLPILQAHQDATPEHLVRLFHRTQLHWVRHLGEEAQLDAGVAFTNPQLPSVRDANQVMDAAVAPGTSPADALEEVRQHFVAAGTVCRQWLMNPAAPEARTKPLVEYLRSAGWTERPYEIMYLAEKPGRKVAETPGLTIIPARASFRHARALAEEAAASSEARAADADMLHLDDPHWDAAIALLDGRAVARAGVLAVGDVGRIEDVYVTEAQRRRGVGRTMLGRALEVCARSLFKHVLLRVSPGDAPAINLCTGFGFRKIGEMIAYEPSDPM